VPVEDEDISKELARLFRKRGIDINVSCKVDKIEEETKGTGATVSYTDSAGKIQTRQAEKVLVAVGRGPRTYDAGIDKTKIQLDRAFIPVNEWMETTEPGRLRDRRYSSPDSRSSRIVGAMCGVVVASKLAGKYARPVRRDQRSGVHLLRSADRVQLV